MIPHRRAFCLCRALAVAGLAACLAAIAHEALADSLSTWAQRVLSSDAQPAWKADLAAATIDSPPPAVTFRTTRYSDKNHLDPHTGGGPWGCTWFNPGSRRALPSLWLRYGHIAADLRHWPTGSVFYAPPPWDRSWVVVDCGPGVKGRHRADIYLPDTPTWNQYATWEREHGTRITVRYLGRITRAQALGGADK